MASLNAIYRMAATNPVAPLLAFGVVLVVGLVSNYGGEDALEKSTSRDELNDLAPFNKSDHGLASHACQYKFVLGSARYGDNMELQMEQHL